MRQPGSHIPAGAYLAGKYKLAEDRKDKLLDVVNRLTQLNYEKGTRHSDQSIRGRVKALMDEVEQNYRMIRAFGAGKGGDDTAFQDILAFFNSRYLERFMLRDLFEEVKQEIVNQANIDRAYEEKHADADHARRVNIYRQDLERDLREWEKILLYQAEPLLRGFLSEVNEIVLYNRIGEKIEQLITNDDVFTLSGPQYQEFKDSIAFFAELNIKLTRLPYTDKEIIEMMTRFLQQMGVRNAMMRARNVNPDIYAAIMMEIISGGRLRQAVDLYSDTSREALDAIRSREKKEDATDAAGDLLKVLEDLIYLEDAKDIRKPAGTTAAGNLASGEGDRYFFHAPGTFDISLKFVSEYMRDSMIFILDWINKDLQKFPSTGPLIRPVLDCLPGMKLFVSYYKLALEEAAMRGNRSGSGSKEKQFISRTVARTLVTSIRDNCTTIQNSLIDVSYNIMNSTLDRSGVLSKKMVVIKESCADSIRKITKGLSEIAKV